MKFAHFRLIMPYQTSSYVNNAIYQTEDAAPNFLYKNDGNLQFTPITDVPIAADLTRSYAAAWVDLDNDGDLDLQLPISYQMRHEFYRNDGSGQLNMETDVVSIDKRALSYGMAAIDYDLNGDLDFFLCIRFDVEPGETSGKAAPNQLYVASESTCNESIQMELRGSTSNTFGVGAKVWVYFTDETGQANGQMQEVVCLNSGGYSGQNGYRLYFGLEAATEADSIVVNWPSGYRQVIGPTNAGHLYYIHEDGNVELKKPFARLKISAEVTPDNTCQVVALSASGNRGRVTWVDADTGEQISEELRLLIKPEDEGRTFQATDFCGRTTSYTIPYKGVTIEMGPNPTSGQLFLKMNSTNQEETTFKAEVTNVLGQHLGFYEWEVAGGYQEEVLDLSSFPSGTYLCAI